MYKHLLNTTDNQLARIHQSSRQLRQLKPKAHSARMRRASYRRGHFRQELYDAIGSESIATNLGLERKLTHKIA